MKDFNLLRIVFMGTPDFAVASLKSLLEEGCNIVAVITAPDKPAGRGMELQQSAVKKFSISKGLKILQPEKLKDNVFINELRSLQADLQIVVAFRMLPEIVWNMPPLGTINVHASLLPQFRGAAPINWAIIRGQNETGVTTFKLKQEIDTGNILLQKKIPIEETDTAGSLHDKLMVAGASLLIQTVKGIASGNIPETAQVIIEPGKIHTAPKIFPETCHINWNQNTQEIYDLIRGLSPFPAAYTQLDDKKLKIYAATKGSIKLNLEPGMIDTDRKTYLRFATNDGYVEITELQLEGRKKMNTGEFLRGYRFIQ